jgi:hypothetical protein
MNEIKQEAVARIINRHMARLLSDLEEAECPKLYVSAVKSAFSWLKSDIAKGE